MATRKRKANRNKNRCKRKLHGLKRIPIELLTEVLACVASRSIKDLFNAKLSCKELHEAASEDYIFEHVTINEFPFNPWRISKGVSSFLDRCKKCENPEALFRQGMIEYFSLMKPQAEEYLKRAARKGHVEATYVYGLILVCYGGPFKQEGLQLLSYLRNCKSRGVIRQCRKKVKSMCRTMWINTYIVGVGPDEPKYPAKTCNCSFITTKKGWISEEEQEEEEYDTACDSCFWDYEATSFCNLLRTGSRLREY